MNTAPQTALSFDEYAEAVDDELIRLGSDRRCHTLIDPAPVRDGHTRGLAPAVTASRVAGAAMRIAPKAPKRAYADGESLPPNSRRFAARFLYGGGRGLFLANCVFGPLGMIAVAAWGPWQISERAMIVGLMFLYLVNALLACAAFIGLAYIVERSTPRGESRSCD